MKSKVLRRSIAAEAGCSSMGSETARQSSSGPTGSLVLNRTSLRLWRKRKSTRTVSERAMKADKEFQLADLLAQKLLVKVRLM